MKKAYILSVYRRSPEADNLAEYAPAASAAIQGAGGGLLLAAPLLKPLKMA